MGSLRLRSGFRALFRRLSQSPDVMHHPEMHRPGHVARPEIEIPAGTDMERVPTGADQSGGAVAIVMEDELAAMQCDVAVGFGIGRLFRDVEGKFFVRNKFGNLLLDNDAVAEDALPIRADEVAAIGRRRRVWKAEPEDPIIGRIGNFGKREHVRPYFGRRRLNQDAIGHDGLLFRVVNHFAEGKQREEREDGQLQL